MKIWSKEKKFRFNGSIDEVILKMESSSIISLSKLKQYDDGYVFVVKERKLFHDRRHKYRVAGYIIPVNDTTTQVVVVESLSYFEMIAIVFFLFIGFLLLMGSHFAVVLGMIAICIIAYFLNRNFNNFGINQFVEVLNLKEDSFIQKSPYQ